LPLGKAVHSAAEKRKIAAKQIEIVQKLKLCDENCSLTIFSKPAPFSIKKLTN
jgi:hypothetical protein